MEKTFQPAQFEEKLYKEWEEKGLNNPKDGKPFTILMPPPNANASLHAGHGMYTADDIMIRYKRLQGYASLWIPGTDHAGIETQYVYEKHLAKQGKSRMDFDRETLYNDIYRFVQDNSGLIYKQFKRLGFLAAWDRSVYTLNDHVLKRVDETFSLMHQQKYVYRSDYLVNYCVHCGTSLADLEVNHIERIDPLYYVKYPLADNPENFISVATVRPEPIFIDTHLAVNPKDKKHKHLIGKKVLNPLTKAEMEIIGDDYVDPKFGTGIVKLTPAHDPNDFKVAKEKGLPIIQAINWDGRIVEAGGKYAGMKVKAARKAVAEDLQSTGLIEKIDEKYSHAVSVCYKCKRDLEPMVIPNWFIKVADLKQKVIGVVQENKVKFHPGKYKKQMLQWLEIMHDWPISRQNVWGIRIPVWYKVDPTASNIYVWWIDKENKKRQGSVSQFLNHEGVKIEEIEHGLQKLYALVGSGPDYVVSSTKPGPMYLQETDTFDTWFSSGQWPLVTLKENEFKDRFPTDMMGTLSDILRFWISRMIMFSLYLTKEVPFKDVYLWSMVADAKGTKMSKSKGNVINPIELVDKYGADAFRATLFFGTATGGTVNLSEDKVRAMRNFANKIWNIGRFLEMNKKGKGTEEQSSKGAEQSDVVKSLHKEFEELKTEYHKQMKAYKFSQAFGLAYEFVWHRFADHYIETLKQDLKDGKIESYKALEGVYIESLRLLHPFTPFVTDAVHKQFTNKLILES